jgi:hypothetical protein
MAGEVSIPLAVLIPAVAYIVAITAYVVRIGYQAASTKQIGPLLGFMQTSGVRLSVLEKAASEVEADFKEHVKGRAGTIDRIWTAIEEIKSRIAVIESRLEQSGGGRPR